MVVERTFGIKSGRLIEQIWKSRTTKSPRRERQRPVETFKGRQRTFHNLLIRKYFYSVAIEQVEQKTGHLEQKKVTDKSDFIGF